MQNLKKYAKPERKQHINVCFMEVLLIFARKPKTLTGIITKTITNKTT